ncbi:MAG TPA: sigma-70 family RNA polymerase sigma factor [Pirellulales bacterium]|nr:sigma-70 family RNA polymerase sigma factor [Pirellulales bacterium]
MDGSEHATIDDLLARARDGETAPRERLFQSSRSYLGLLARAQVERNLQSKVDASDLVQQSLLEAHRDFDRFEGRTEAEWLAWLRHILSNNAADMVRRFRGTQKRQARREVPLRQPGDDSQVVGAAEPAAGDPTPSQQLICRDRELQLAEALERLSVDHRLVVELRNLQRLSFEEVGQRMGRTRPAVQMLWARAIKKLQQELDAGAEQED